MTTIPTNISRLGIRSILIDTGVLLRYGVKSDPRDSEMIEFVNRLADEGYEICCAAQSLREMWNVLTRPVTGNGYGIDTVTTVTVVISVRATFFVLHDGPETYREWGSLVERYEVQGKNVHDTSLVATAVAHGVQHLATLNERDFRRFSEITLVPVVS